MDGCTDRKRQREIEKSKVHQLWHQLKLVCLAAAPAISTGVMQLKLHQKQSNLKALPCLVAARGSLINKPQVQVFSIFRACLIFNCGLRSGSNHRAEQLGKQTTRRSSDSNRKHKRVQWVPEWLCACVCVCVLLDNGLQHVSRCRSTFTFTFCRVYFAVERKLHCQRQMWDGQQSHLAPQVVPCCPRGQQAPRAALPAQAACSPPVSPLLVLCHRCAN